MIPREDAPCQQVVHTSGIDLHALLPIPTHSEHDNGPYITAGLVIARNPRTGVQNVSINRIQVHGPDRMAILLLPRHLYAFQRAAEEAGDALDVAIAIGVDPLTMLASQAITPIDHDELEIAGALHGAPLPVVAMRDERRACAGVRGDRDRRAAFCRTCASRKVRSANFRSTTARRKRVK